MRIARPPVVASPGGDRLARRGGDTATVPKGASIIAIISERIARA
jgi:hypothetical protein